MQQPTQTIGVDSGARAACTTRDIVIGRNSKVWRALQAVWPAGGRLPVAIGHAELGNFVFKPDDRVWVLSYSRRPQENTALLQALAAARVQEIVYLSSSSTIVCTLTRCYEYPRVKLQAETEALQLPNARVLTVGLMYADAAELPAGANVATSYEDLARFMAQPRWSGDGARQAQIFRTVQRPFSHPVEGLLYRGYALLIGGCGRRPCLLRPLDLILRSLHMRWYGYTFLANRLWISKTS